MNDCINCGEQVTLHALAVPENETTPFLEHGEFGADTRYSLEHPVVILECTTCKHEMIDLSS